jgi:hypothetical protein
MKEEILAVLNIVQGRDSDWSITTSYDGKVELKSGQVQILKDNFSIMFIGITVTLWYSDIVEIGFILAKEAYSRPVVNIVTKRA